MIYTGLPLKSTMRRIGGVGRTTRTLVLWGENGSANICCYNTYTYSTTSNVQRDRRDGERERGGDGEREKEREKDGGTEMENII